MTTHRIDTFKVRDKKRKKDTSSSFGKPLIVLDEVDLEFEDEVSFDAGIRAIIDKSCHPVILLCNGKSSTSVIEF
jgi:hypothetical protein